MFRKFLIIFLGFTVFSLAGSFTQGFNQNFFNNSFSPVVIPGVVNSTSVGFYLDFFNPFQASKSFDVFIGGDNGVFSKDFNFSKNFTLKPYEHFRLNATLPMPSGFNSDSYYLMVVMNTSNSSSEVVSVLKYFLFGYSNLNYNTSSNYFNTFYSPSVVSTPYSLRVFIDFFNPYDNVSNFSIVFSNVPGFNYFQEESFNVTLGFLQHAKFSAELTLAAGKPSVVGQNPEVWVRVYDLNHKTLVARVFESFSSLALPPSQQKSVSSVVQECFSFWVLILILVLIFFFFLFSISDYYSGLKRVRKKVDRAVERISRFCTRVWRGCSLAARDFLSLNAVYRVFKVLLVLIVFLLLLQSLNIIQVFPLYYLLALVFVLGVFLAIEKK